MRNTDPLDATFDVLSDPHRRYAVSYLMGTNTDQDLGDVAAAVADRGSGDRQSETDIEAALHHNHLPRLDDAGIVEYDPERTAVRYVPERNQRNVIEMVVDEPGVTYTDD